MIAENMNKFDKKEEIKKNVLDKLVGRLTPEELKIRISDFYGYAKQSPDKEQYWTEEAKACEALLADEDYLNGIYPQSIDNLLLELIEWRAMVHAINSVEFKDNPFRKYVFFAQWASGAVYAIFNLLGKLSGTNKDFDKNSLPFTWEYAADFLVEDKICTADENMKITSLISLDDLQNGQFHKNNSKATAYRHKVISHNELSASIDWAELDKDIALLSRKWSLLTQWTGPVLLPFRDDSVQFQGIENFFSQNELRELKVARNQYIEKFEGWCTTNLVDKNIKDVRKPFASIKVSVAIKPINKEKPLEVINE